METKTIRIHRVGTITFGVILVTLGTAFLLQLLLNLGVFPWIFRLWPAALILLGGEVLLGSRRKTYEIVGKDGQMVEQCKMIYDGPAIVLTACTLFFTWALAWVDWMYVNEMVQYW